MTLLLNALLFCLEESQREALPLLQKLSPSPLRERGIKGGEGDKR